MAPAVGRRDANTLLRRLPSVDEVLRSPLGQEFLAHAPRWAVLRAARDEIDRLRAALLAVPAGETAPEPGPDGARMRAAVGGLLAPSPLRVVNATGRGLRTHLG